MTERPILFSAPMVRALLDGTKTQTRRVVKPQPLAVTLVPSGNHLFDYRDDLSDYSRVVDMKKAVTLCPYGQPGDRLWVREAWQAFFDDEVPADRPRGPRHTLGQPARPDRKSFVFYRADGDGPVHKDGYKARWMSPLHMPRKYSRLNLEVTGLRVERLQDISEADAIAEGVPNSLHLPGGRFARENFAHVWWAIHGDDAWEANPWVWVVEFKLVEGGAA